MKKEHIEMSARLEGNNIEVAGKTTLNDGAKLVVSISNGLNYFREEVVVENGKFKTETYILKEEIVSDSDIWVEILGYFKVQRESLTSLHISGNNMDSTYHIEGTNYPFKFSNPLMILEGLDTDYAHKSVLVAASFNQNEKGLV